MERIITWWVNNPVAANLLMFAILLAGVLGFMAVEREAYPVFKSNRVEISVSWPGAAPQEVEEQIIIRIEEALSNLDSVYRVNSNAHEGYGRLNVQTYPSVDIENFVNDVKMVVDSVNSLPGNIEKPRVKRIESRGEMIRVAVHGNISERELTRLAEDLRGEMAALPFISIVRLFGIRKEEVSIELSEEALRRFSLSFAEVTRAIRASSINLSSGKVRTETGDVLLRTRNLADSEEDFKKIVIRQSADGGIVRIGDVARVVDGFDDNELLATLNGEPSVLIQALTTDHMQVVRASDAVSAWMERRQETLPEGVSLTLWFDTADVYKNRMGTIGQSAILGLLLVFLILILTLRPKVALWVTAGIAVAFMGTFSMLPTYGVSLNIMSTFSFLLVLGIVVDDAIVVGESIHQQSHKLGGGPQSAITGATLVSKPVIYAVLTTMVAFAPWFFISGAGTQVTRQFSIVITIALLISLIEAFLILPSHLRQLKPRKALKGLSLWQKRIEQNVVDFAHNTYRPLVEVVVNRRYLTASIFVAAFIISLGLFNSGWVKFSFMPVVESERISINVVLPTGTPYSRALSVLDQLQKAELQLIDEVNQRARTDGGSGKLIEGWYTRSRRESVLAIIKLSPPEVRDLSAKQAAMRLRELVGDIPDADEIKVGYTMNNSGQNVAYVIRHRDLELLRTASNELKAQLDSYEGTYFVRDSMGGESDELHMQLLPGAEKLGVTLAQVSRQVRQAYYGEEVQRLPRENGDVKVMVRYPRDLRYNLESLNEFRVHTEDGRQIPLLSVVGIELTRGVRAIQRRDGERTSIVFAEVGDDMTSDIRKDMSDNFLPEFKKRYPELKLGHGGQAKRQEEFFNEILALYAIALFTMYALIAIAFHSYWLPLLVMIAIPFGFMGAVYGHLLFGVSMAIFSYFGIGAAAGVVVNDNLVLVDYIQRMKQEGKSAVDAVIESAVERFRPILLTSITTFVGLAPIMMERSTDAQYLKPAVLALAFGVLFALFVTLLMVPALYCIGEDLSGLTQKAKRRFIQIKSSLKTA